MADELYFVKERQLDYPVFDSDNHMYENTDAFTKFLPSGYEGVVKYIQDGNRTKLSVKDRITRDIPNPTFQRVAPPGGQQDDPEHRRSIAGLDAFFDVEARYKLMNEYGINRSLMWPTLASVIEQSIPEDPLAQHVIIHALNEWMYEHWTFGYEDAIFPTPAICMAVVLPEFDPFWELVQEKDVVVGLHNTVNRRFPVDLAELDGTRENGGYFEQSYAATAPFRALATPRWHSSDMIASMIGHGMLTRFPRLKVAIVEHFNQWTRPMIQQFQEAYEKTPVLFDEDPMEVLRRNIFIHIFQDPNPVELIKLVGVQNSMFGSDFPHPEGLRDPLGFSEAIESLPAEDQKAVMGGNLARIMKVAV
jgi:hypothetical protein